jgi:aspartate kinase
MEIKVFKFGGASVNSAKGVRNLASILQRYPDDNILVVVSAMGKTTNALEELLRFYLERDAVAMVESFKKIKEYHFKILYELFNNREHPVYASVDKVFDHLRGYLRRGHLTPGINLEYDPEYDAIVSHGELISTVIVNHWLTLCGITSALFDAREMIRTDSLFRDARVDWDLTTKLIRNTFKSYFKTGNTGRKIAVTQGFIGQDDKKNTTTLGREGSDYSAAIFAYALKTKEVTIWKDVPGVLNADPKWFGSTRKLARLSYREAIELAYFGASVIHPKTIKPLENANIVLRVKSFLKPQLEGTSIENLEQWEVPFPIYILKKNQVLISISPRDFSFIVEENLSQIFDILAGFHVKVNVMQNSAISFSICVDGDHLQKRMLTEALSKNYSVRYNDNLDLYTIRHYTPAAFKRITRNRKVFLEQKTRSTLHLVVK